MAEAVDSIVVDLIARTDQYEQRFQRVIGLHKQLIGSLGEVQAGQQRYQDQHARSGVQIANDEEATTQKVTRSRKKRTDTFAQADRAEVASAKASANARAETEEQAQARIAAAVERGQARQRAANRPGRGGVIGATVPREGTGQASIPAAVLAGGAAEEVAGEREVNAALVEQTRLQAGLLAAKGEERAILRDEIADLRIFNQLTRAGLTDEAAAVELERIRGARESARTRQAEAAQASQGRKDLTRFAEGAGLGRSYGSVATVGGIAAAGAVGVGVAAVSSAVDFAKQLQVESQALGISTAAIQVYRVAADRLGVSQEQLNSGLGQFSANLGKAQEGSQQQQKVFAALGIDIGSARDGFKSAGDILPTLIERLSSIPDPARRAAVEVQLFGEEGRRLDGLLSGGTDKITGLADAMERAGSVLSEGDIQTLNRAAVVLNEVKNQLEVDISRVVAGNASAITTLANAFGALADRIGGAIQKSAEYAKIAGNSFGGYGKYSLLPLLGGAAGAAYGGYEGAAALAKPGADPADRAAIAALGRTQPGAVNQGLLNKLNAPKPPKGKSADTLAREADARQKRYEDELARSDDEYLQAKRELTVGADAQLAADQETLRRAHVRRNQDILREANEKRIDASKVVELQAAEQRAYLEKQRVLQLHRDIQIEQGAYQLRQAAYDTDLGRVRDDEVSANTAAERRKLELQALRIERDKRVDTLNNTINSKDPNVTDTDRDLARQQLGEVEGDYEVQQRAVRRGSRGPLEEYRDQLPKTTSQINEALQSIEVQGLRGLDDAITGTISKVFHLGGAFGSIADQIISDLIRIGVEREIIGPLANGLFGKSGDGGGGGKLGSTISSIGSAIGSFFGHRASGGNVVAGVPYRVGELGEETFVPAQSGRIVPNNGAVRSAAGGITLHQTIQIDASGVNPQGYTDHIVGITRRETAAAISASGRQLLDATPARIKRQQTLGS